MSLALSLWRWLVSLFHRPVPLHMGVSVFTGWASPRPEYGYVPGVQCPVKWPWADMKEANRVPAVGQYDEAALGVTAWRIAQMMAGKVEWCTYQHEWSFHLNKLIMNHCAENHPGDSQIQFAMSWWDVLSAATDELNMKYWDGTYQLNGTIPVWTKENISAGLVAYGRACAPIMAKASYLTVDARPVLFRGYADSLQFYSRFQLSPRDVLDLISQGIGQRPYFVATSCNPQVYPLLKSWGFDAVTEYALNSDSWADAMKLYSGYWKLTLETCRATGLDFWVPAFAGFDARGYLPEADAAKLGYSEPPTPADFTAHLKDARSFAQANAKYTRGRIITYAWSEFYEGGIIEPMKLGMLHSGDEMLRAFAAAQ